MLNDIINKLLALGLSPLPVAPKQDSPKYLKKNKTGEIELDKDGNPISFFTGKNPSYLDRNGVPKIVEHKKYQNEQPKTEEIESWFQHSDTGIGSLGSNNFVWIDIDCKHFDSVQDCDRAFWKLLEDYPVLNGCWLEQTHSGGFRIGVKVRTPSNTCQFSLTPKGKHVGEILARKGYAVLAPTIGVSGKPYINLNFPDEIPEVESLESIGIYPVKSNKETTTTEFPLKYDSTINTATTQTVNSGVVNTAVISKKIQSFDEYKEVMRKNGATGIYLIEVISSKSKDIFNGTYDEKIDRSKALATLLKDLFGWENWLKANNEKFYGDPIELAVIAGTRLGLDSDKIDRIIASRGDTSSLEPAIKESQGDEGCFKRVKTLLNNCVEPTVVIETDVNEVNNSVEETIFQGLFEGGKGNYVVINQSFYKYTGKGYWRLLTDTEVEKLITERLPNLFVLRESNNSCKKDYRFATERNKKNSLSYGRSKLSLENNAYNEHLLCFQNGTVDLRTGDLQPHSIYNYLTSTITADYVKNAACPQIFIDYIDGLLDKDFLQLVRAILRMFLDPTSLYGYFPHLIGASGSGKGVFIRFVTSLYNEANVRSISSFDDLNTPEKRHQNLTNARLVTFPDLGGFQRGLGAFYELVDNGSNNGRPLFSSTSYNKKWYTRFIIASVDFLQIENSGDGWDRRCIPLPTKPRTKDTDPNFEDKLQLVKSEVISWTLAMSKEECEKTIINGHKFNQAIVDIKDEQSKFSNSIKVFVDQCLRPSNDVNKILAPGKIYEYYVVFCKANGFSPNNSNKFREHLKKHVLPKNFIDRKPVKKEGKVTNIPAHYNYIQVAPGVFQEQTDSLTPITINNKQCSEGGLTEFKEFWNTDLKPHIKNIETEETAVIIGNTESPKEVIETVELKEPEVDYENLELLQNAIIRTLSDEHILGKLYYNIKNKSSLGVQKQLENYFKKEGIMELIEEAYKKYKDFKAF